MKCPRCGSSDLRVDVRSRSFRRWVGPGDCSGEELTHIESEILEVVCGGCDATWQSSFDAELNGSTGIRLPKEDIDKLTNGFGSKAGMFMGIHDDKPTPTGFVVAGATGYDRYLDARSLKKHMLQASKHNHITWICLYDGTKILTLVAMVFNSAGGPHKCMCFEYPKYNGVKL